MIKAHNPHTRQRTVVAAIPTYISSVAGERREGAGRGDVTGSTPAVERRHTAYSGAGTVNDKWHGRLFDPAETGMLHRRHETAALDMLIVDKSQWSIYRHTGNPLRLHQLGDLRHRESR